MRGQIFVAGLVLVLLGADATKNDPAKEEAAKLEGTWTVVSQSEERDLPNSFKVAKIVIKGNRLTLTLKTKEGSVCEFTVDPTQDPKHLDRTFVEGRLKGKTYPGIYQLDGDELNYSYSVGSPSPDLRGRPKEFKGDSVKAGTVVLVLKREKP